MEHERFNILSLSGGGFMGLYAARVLADLERLKGTPLRRSFDLIVGTSVGGILALAIANEAPMKDVVRVLEARGERIFSPRATPLTRYQQARDLLRFVSGSKYSSVALREAIKLFVPEGQTMDQIDSRVAICSVNLTRGLPHTFRSPYLKEHSNSSGIRTVDVALATSAAPVLLPVHRISDDLFCDGAAYANSPDLVAVHEAESLCGVNISRIHMLSLGTTSAAYDFGRPRKLSLGVREWMTGQRFVKMTMSCQQNHANRIVGARLSERYFRVDETQSKSEAHLVGLDVANSNARKVLRSLSQKTVNRISSDHRLIGFLEHQARPVVNWYPNNGIMPGLR